jgi:hypothetical protein
MPKFLQYQQVNAGKLNAFNNGQQEEVCYVPPMMSDMSECGKLSRLQTEKKRLIDFDFETLVFRFWMSPNITIHSSPHFGTYFQIGTKTIYNVHLQQYSPGKKQFWVMETV